MARLSTALFGCLDFLEDHVPAFRVTDVRVERFKADFQVRVDRRDAPVIRLEVGFLIFQLFQSIQDGDVDEVAQPPTSVILEGTDHVDFADGFLLERRAPRTSACDRFSVGGCEEQAVRRKSGVRRHFLDEFLFRPVSADIAFHDVAPGLIVTRSVCAELVALRNSDLRKIIEVGSDHLELGERFFNPLVTSEN